MQRTLKRETDAGRRQLAAQAFAWVVGMSDETALNLIHRIIDLKLTGESDTDILIRTNRGNR